MSLNWNFTKCNLVRDADGTLTDKNLAKWLDMVVYSTYAVDLGTITEDNISEWMWRQKCLLALGRSICLVDGKPAVIPEFVLRSLIGFYTNVPTRTRRQWLMSQMDSISRSIV